MNLFLEYQKKFLLTLKALKKKKIIYLPENLNIFTVELPPTEYNCDISYNAAMMLAKLNKKSPFALAEIFKESFIKEYQEFDNINIAKPGFLNITFKKNFWKKYLSNVLKLGTHYGSNKISKKKYNVEFVSANPTGPLHVGHCRGAIIGDVLSNLLKFNGHLVTKEYYVNDYGKQIENFTLSVYNRILEIVKKKSFPLDQNLYTGNYIIYIANKIIKSKEINNFDNLDKINKKLTNEALKCSIDLIRNNLSELGVKHDSFVYESKLIKDKKVLKSINKLKKQNFVYEGKLQPPKGELTEEWADRKQLLFKSTLFGDDTDRALQKIDNTWTYFASDIAYHSYKIDKKFNELINILGADHSGYTKRISAAVLAMSKNKIKLTCKVSQLVKLIKDGEPFKMSKRKGDYITVSDLLKEVGKDSVRFMMLNRSNDVELEFDFKKVTEKSKDNPVFYVQYAYARINSIFRSINLDLKNKIKIENENFLLNNHEIEILKKILEWPKCVDVSCSKLESHRLTFYLYDLATLFHSYWNLGSKNEKFRFVINHKISNKSRFQLLQALAITIENGMSILGVSTPKSM